MGRIQRGFTQAFWEFANGEICTDGPVAGGSVGCSDLGQPTGPDGEEVSHVVLLGRALQYALTKQPPAGGTFQALFDDMGEYMECLYRVGDDTREPFNSFASILAHHGFNIFAPSPRMCPQICGDGLQQVGEACDGDDFDGLTCGALGYDGGSLHCTAGCAIDESNCSTCGNGVLEAGEECDGANLGGANCADVTDGAAEWGSISCNADCTWNAESCEDCQPGTVDCRCLDVDTPGEEHPELFDGGILGDGRYCQDDVYFGGDVRCIDPPGGEERCVQCTFGQGVWCPCDQNSGCGLVSPQAYEGPATGSVGDNWVCEAACDPAFPDTCDVNPALGHGYCFVQGESPLEGGVPPWFFDQYCTAVAPGLQCVQQLGEPRFCTFDGGPLCLPQ